MRRSGDTVRNNTRDTTLLHLIGRSRYDRIPVLDDPGHPHELTTW